MPSDPTQSESPANEDDRGLAVDRREAIKVLAAGSTAFFPLSQLSSPAVVQGAAAAASADKWAPRFLSSRQDELVTTLAELLLPQTHAPGPIETPTVAPN